MATASGINLKREDPAFGPTIHIDTSTPDAVTAVDKLLTCGSLKIQGVKRQSPDPKLLWFRFSEEEFVGISKLPSYAACTLNVSVGNNVGSLVSKTQTLFFTFDKGPTLEIEKTVGNPGLNGPNVNHEISIESYKIKNTATYPVRIRFAPVRIFEHSLCYNYQIQGARPVLKPLLTCNQEVMRASANSIKIDGDYHALTEDVPNTAVFTLEPNGWATVSSSYRIAEGETLPLSGVYVSIDTSTKYVRTFAGIYIAGFLNYAQEALTLEPTLPFTALRPSNTPNETLAALKLTVFTSVQEMRRPDYLMMR